MSDLPREIDEMQLQEILKRASEHLKKTSSDKSISDSDQSGTSPGETPAKPQ